MHISADVCRFMQETSSEVSLAAKIDETVKKQTSKEQEVSEQRCLVKERGQWRKLRLARVDRTAQVTQMNTMDYCDQQKSVSKCTIL